MESLENWKIQIRKGYLELCILQLIEARQRLYGFELLEMMADLEIPVKEGTLYPLLNRMTVDGNLSATWETDNLKGHPRKFYSLTRQGRSALSEMKSEYLKMNKIFNKTQSKRGLTNDEHEHST